MTQRWQTLDLLGHVGMAGYGACGMVAIMEHSWAWGVASFIFAIGFSIARTMRDSTEQREDKA